MPYVVKDEACDIAVDQLHSGIDQNPAPLKSALFRNPGYESYQASQARELLSHFQTA
jgi:hypothetical protein